MIADCLRDATLNDTKLQRLKRTEAQHIIRRFFRDLRELGGCYIQSAELSDFLHGGKNFRASCLRIHP